MSTASSDGYDRAPWPDHSHQDHLSEHIAMAGHRAVQSEAGAATTSIERGLVDLMHLRGLLNLRVSQPVFETYFFPADAQGCVGKQQLRELIPAVRFQRRSDNLAFYPADAASHCDGNDLTSNGWLVRADRDGRSPSWGWALGTSSAFLDRQEHWEDYNCPSHLPRGLKRLDQSWLVSRICMMLHLLQRCANWLDQGDATGFVVGARLTGCDGRHLIAERGQDSHRARPCAKPEVEVHRRLTIGRLRKRFREVAVDLVGEVAWNMERPDAESAVIETWLETAANTFGRQTLFPDDREAHTS